MEDAVDYRLNTYLETKNPIDAWHCYKNARQSGRDIPEEILQYLDGAAEAIIAIANDPPEPKNRPLSIAIGMGLAKKGSGPGSAFKAYSDRLKDWQIAVETFRQLQAWGDGGDDYVFEGVANKFETSKATVRRKYNTYMRQWTEKARALIEDGTITFNPNGKASPTLTPGLSSIGDGIFLREVNILMEIAKTLRDKPD